MLKIDKRNVTKCNNFKNKDPNSATGNHNNKNKCVECKINTHLSKAVHFVHLGFAAQGVQSKFRMQHARHSNRDTAIINPLCRFCVGNVFSLALNFII